MQASVVRSRTGCTEADQKEWRRKGVVVPVFPGNGPGVHADYDEANVLATAIALRMKQAHIVVAKYAPALQQLQVWLRSHSRPEWSGHTTILTPDSALVISSREPLPAVRVGFVADLGTIYREVPEVNVAGICKQIPLAYGREAVR